MAEFVKGNQLNSSLEEILEKAEEQLIIISPFIKLHSRYKDVLKSKINEHRLKIIIVFGKNESKISKSFTLQDFIFFKDFPNIEIKYEPRLHAKFYANDYSALLSSMNLYDFSQNNNIEFGILTKASLLNNLTSSLFGDSFDKEAFNYFDIVINNSKLLYKKIPIYEEKMLGLTKKYIRSDEKINELDEMLEVSSNEENRKSLKLENNDGYGYCIRTGEKIPFNPKNPFTKKAFESWNKYKDENYKEKYCHFSGELSNGETSFSRPILKKNWNKAKRII